jgi:hypothetical protein
MLTEVDKDRHLASAAYSNLSYDNIDLAIFTEVEARLVVDGMNRLFSELSL